MKNFIIAAGLHGSGVSNGVLYLIRLGKTLEKLGFKVYFLPIFSEFPQAEIVLDRPLSQFVPQNAEAQGIVEGALLTAKVNGIRLLDDFSPAFINNSYVLYSERIIENPLKAKHVIRFFANKEGVLNGGKKVNVGKDDFILAHSIMMHQKPDYVLFFAEVNFLFHDRGTVPALDRSLDVTYIGKGRMYGDISAVNGTIVIDRFVPARKDGLAVLLRNTRFFFTLDALSHINVEAIMCGAIPVILRYTPWSPEEIDNMELGKLPRMEIIEKGKINLDWPKFTKEVNDLKDKLAFYQQSWDARVGDFTKRLATHFHKK